MKIPKFTADDFLKQSEGTFVQWQNLADMVNKRLEEFEKSCVRVYGVNDTNAWIEGQLGNSEKSALLFCIERINQAVTKDEIISALRNVTTFRLSGDSGLAVTCENKQPKLSELADRIEKFGMK